MKRILKWIAAGLLTLAAGCAALGVPSPETFNQRLAVGYSTVTEVRRAATTLLTAQKLSVADAENVLKQTDNARTGLDLAKSMHATTPLLAADKLSATITALSALQTYLATRR